MRTSWMLGALGLLLAAACSSQPSTTGSTSEANSISQGPPYSNEAGVSCCASVNQGAAGSAPACRINDDCCSGLCDNSVCVCALPGGFCAANEDCCGNGVCQNKTSTGLGRCSQ